MPKSRKIANKSSARKIGHKMEEGIKGKEQSQEEKLGVVICIFQFVLPLVLLAFLLACATEAPVFC